MDDHDIHVVNFLFNQLYDRLAKLSVPEHSQDALEDIGSRIDAAHHDFAAYVENERARV